MTCKLGALLEADTMAEPDRSDLADMLGAPTPYTAAVLAEALTLEGHAVSTTTIKDHRGNRCVCHRTKGTP